MKVLILKGDAPRHNFFANEISKIPNIEIKIISPKRLGNKRLFTMLKKSPKTFFARVSKYLVYFFIHWNEREKNFFGNKFDFKETIVENINSEKTIKLVEEFKPDLIASFGVPIVCDKIINIPKFGAINLHGGISPEYKGGNTIFWAVFEGHPEMAGATIHQMISKVDSGIWFSKVYPEILPNDDECSISCKTFKAATTEFIRLIKWINEHNQKAVGMEQEGKSALYKADKRNFFVSLKGLITIPKKLKGIYLKERIERNYEK